MVLGVARSYISDLYIYEGSGDIMAAKSKSDTYLYIRVNSDLKESFREVCENSGMTSSGALKQFMASSVQRLITNC